MTKRRRILVASGAAIAAAGLGLAEFGRSLWAPGQRPLALVYRGPASCSGCSEAVASLLVHSPARFRTEYVGPREDLKISAATLANAVVYAQPGGGSVDSAWRKVRGFADDIRAFVHGGGHYLGFCLGAYLAGATPGFQLLPGDTDEFVGSPGANVSSTDDTVIEVRWRGRPIDMYFQDGPVFKLTPGAPATVLATYNTGAPAAVIADYGSGRVGVVGPHPEADASWYSSANLKVPDRIDFEPGYDLIESTVPDPTTPASL